MDTTGPRKRVLVREVSLFQKLICMQKDLRNCPDYRGVLIREERFHCTHIHKYAYMLANRGLSGTVAWRKLSHGRSSPGPS